MQKFVILGGKRLSGEVRIAGFKNAVLPLLAATLLSDKPSTLTNVPDILDVRNLVQLLTGVGAKVVQVKGKVKISTPRILSAKLDTGLASAMRASVVLLGALIARAGRVQSPYPGGDLIGARPIDVHLRAFTQLGANVLANKKSISINARHLRGKEVFAESSVTGTENIILAATAASGKTVLKLAAQEPHITSLCRFLVAMGARIEGIGTHTLLIRGGKSLHGARTRVIPDMLEAGSFAILSAATGSDLVIRDVDHQTLDAVYNKLEEMGVKFEKYGSDLVMHKPKKLHSATIRTGLYPNLATDLQPPFGVLATQAHGVSVIHDWIFEGRLGYLRQLQRMGAKVEVLDLHRARIHGRTPLRGASMDSLDIRSGMTLVIAGLVARGKTVISSTHNIDRGYERLPERLRSLGADIQRVG